MRALLHTASAQLAIVESADGYDLTEWTDLGDLGAVDPTLAIYDATSGKVVEDIAAARLARSVQATAWRDQRIAAGCTTSFGVADADDVSRANILGAVSMAMIAKGASEAFSIQWRMHDNSYQTFDADQAIQFGVEVGSFINTCYQASFVIKNAIEAATTRADIEAVDITAGYPS